MIHVFHVDVLRNDVNVAFDSHKRAVHLLEVEYPVLCSTEAVKLAQESVYSRIAPFLLEENPRVRWLIYSIKGCVMEFDDERFTSIELHEKDLYLPFSKKMKIRRLSFLT